MSLKMMIGSYYEGTKQSSKNANLIHVLLLLLLLGCIIVVGASYDKHHACEFPAIYNFGDSNSDTGSLSAMYGGIPPPTGRTFFGEPSGRESDGRLIIDFLANKLGMPFLDAYLDSMSTNFRHGANFAASGATIEAATGKLIDAGLNPISLSIQFSEFKHLKNRSVELYAKECGRSSDTLPRPKDFEKALYTIDIGQNDLHFKLNTFTLDQVLESIPDLINQTALVVQNLYEEGGRSFWIHNTGPIGCLPYLLVESPLKAEDKDEIGCIKSYNKLAQEFNKQLKDKVFQLRDQLRDAAFIYVDIYSAKYTLFKDATKQGFVDPHGYCCKHPENPSLRCWDVSTVNGTAIYATSCSNPNEYISWDSLHLTEAANHWIFDHIWDGSHSNPSLPITKACPNFASQD